MKHNVDKLLVDKYVSITSLLPYRTTFYSCIYTCMEYLTSYSINLRAFCTCNFVSQYASASHEEYIVFHDYYFIHTHFHNGYYFHFWRIIKCKQCINCVCLSMKTFAFWRIFLYSHCWEVYLRYFELSDKYNTSACKYSVHLYEFDPCSSSDCFKFSIKANLYYWLLYKFHFYIDFANTTSWLWFNSWASFTFHFPWVTWVESGKRTHQWNSWNHWPWKYSILLIIEPSA